MPPKKVTVLNWQDESFFTGPKKMIPLQVIRNSKATVTFTSFAKSGDQTKILRELKINLIDNTAFFTNTPDKKLKIIWYSDFFVAEGLPKGNDQFFFVWKSIDWSRKTENGITAFLFCGAFVLTTIVSAIINNGNNRTAISTVYVAITFICYPNYIFYWKEYDINSS